MTMVDEHDDRFEGQEEEEYHFSDDQINYEPDIGAAPSSPKTSGTNIFAKVKQKREWVLGAVTLIVLIVFVYKLIAPAPSQPAFELAASSAGKKSPAVTHQKESSAPMTPAAAMPSVPHPTATPSSTMLPAASIPQSSPTQPSPPVTPASTSMALPVVSTPSSPASTGTDEPGPGEAAATILLPSTSAAQKMSDGRAILDRLTTVEQQNSAVMNLLQTEYAQKLSDYQTQNLALRGKVVELTKQLNSIEHNLTQLTQLLTGAANKAAAEPLPQSSVSHNNTAPLVIPGAFGPVPASAKPPEPKLAYTVQAIIPGRAWLKAETGETVTVAEGDILKDYGRVIKIDPYDGIVEIDTGNKTITLSYGVWGE